MHTKKYELIIIRSDGTKARHFCSTVKHVKSLLNCICSTFTDEIYLNIKDDIIYRVIATYPINPDSSEFSYSIIKTRYGFTLKKN